MIGSLTSATTNLANAVLFLYLTCRMISPYTLTGVLLAATTLILKGLSWKDDAAPPMRLKKSNWSLGSRFN